MQTNPGSPATASLTAVLSRHNDGDGDEFALDIQVTTDVAGAGARRCDSSDTCSKTCASACVSA